jgi:hypothetical protein
LTTPRSGNVVAGIEEIKKEKDVVDNTDVWDMT